MNNPITTIDISASTILRVVAVVLLVGLFFAIWKILASIFFAIVVAAALEPTLRRFEQRRIPRGVTVPAMYLLAFGAFFGLFYATLPTLYGEVRTLSQDLPAQYETFLNDFVRGGLFEGAGFLKPALDQALLNFESSLTFVGPGDALGFALSLFGGVVSFALVLIISFYLALQYKGVERFLRMFTPKQHEEYVADLWGRIERRLGRWMQAQFVLAVFMGVSVFIVLTILDTITGPETHVPFILTISILAGLLEVVPFIGPISVGIVMFLFISLVSPLLALAAVGLYVLLQQIEQNVIIPSIMSRVVGVNPILVIIAVLVGAELAGFWGIVLAIPMVGILGEVVRDVRQAN